MAHTPGNVHFHCRCLFRATKACPPARLAKAAHGFPKVNHLFCREDKHLARFLLRERTAQGKARRSGNERT